MRVPRHLSRDRQLSHRAHASHGSLVHAPSAGPTGSPRFGASPSGAPSSPSTACDHANRVTGLALGRPAGRTGLFVRTGGGPAAQSLGLTALARHADAVLDGCRPDVADDLGRGGRGGSAATVVVLLPALVHSGWGASATTGRRRAWRHSGGGASATTGRRRAWRHGGWGGSNRPAWRSCSVLCQWWGLHRGRRLSYEVGPLWATGSTWSHSRP